MQFCVCLHDDDVAMNGSLIEKYFQKSDMGHGRICEFGYIIDIRQKSMDSK